MAALVIGFVIALFRLLDKFYQFRGLGMITNFWSVIFLVALTVVSGVLYLGSTIVGLSGLLEKLSALFAPLGAPVLANVATVILPRKPGNDPGAASGVKDFELFKSTNFIFEYIRDAIADGLDNEVDRMARRYELDQIRDTASRLIENDVATQRITRQAGDDTLSFLRAIPLAADARADFDNKYKALHHVIQVTSFFQLRSRLAKPA